MELGCDTHPEEVELDDDQVCNLPCISSPAKYLQALWLYQNDALVVQLVVVARLAQEEENEVD